MPPWRIYVEKARQAALGITVTVAFTAGAVYVFSNATYYGLRKFKRRHVCRDAKKRAVVLSDNVENLIWQTMDDAHVSGYQRGNLMFFPSRYANSALSNVAEPVWRGSLYMRSGGSIGVPFFYNWEGPKDFDLNQALENWKINPANLTDADAQELKRLCTLSTEARKYGIARALSLMYNNEVLYGILHFEFFLFTSLTTATFAWNAHAKPIVNAAGFFANYVLWRLVTLWYRGTVYKKGVKAATSLSEITATGADEFYEKTAKLNALVSRLRGTSPIVQYGGKVFSYLFSMRPRGMSLEAERHLANETRRLLDSGDLVYKPLFRVYGAARKRMAIPPVPILPTSEAVSEPDKFLKRGGYEGDLEQDLLSGPHFRHLQRPTDPTIHAST